MSLSWSVTKYSHTQQDNGEATEWIEFDKCVLVWLCCSCLCLYLYGCVCVCVCDLVYEIAETNEVSVGVCQREDGPTRPDGNKSSSGTREEVTGQTRAK